MARTFIEVDDETYTRIRLAAQVAGISAADVVRRAIAALLADPPPAVDRWQPVPIYGVYGGRRVEAVFIPATSRVVVTGEPLPNAKFKSPSGAAQAVVRALNPDRARVNVSGWQFWRLADSDARLEVFRRA